MQRLEVSGAVRLIYRSLGVKGLRYVKQGSSCRRDTKPWNLYSTRSVSKKLNSAIILVVVEQTDKDRGSWT